MRHQDYLEVSGRPATATPCVEEQRAFVRWRMRHDYVFSRRVAMELFAHRTCEKAAGMLLLDQAQALVSVVHNDRIATTWSPR